MLISEKDAKKQPCPSARAFTTPQDACRGSDCMAWRFAAPKCDARWLSAMKKARDETGEKGPSAGTKAATLIADDPARYGLPVGEDRLGYCGLGGPVEVAG